jgi:para-nitrobenzyl esterase
MHWGRLAQILTVAVFSLEAHASVVHTQNGDVQGVQRGQVESFKAIPYAKPPKGDLRWQPPQDPDPWNGTRDASDFSAKCPQNQLRRGSDVFIGDEDCLYLNVFEPSGANGLPVIVFFHGGSLVDESASYTAPDLVPVYDGSRLAEHGKVVVVTLNYRLGPFGFLSHKELSKETGYKGSGNQGYMDQVQALKWVQNNIAAFGGDPNDVTIFGQSAGGTSVWVHISSPLSKGLFHRAIVDSAVEDKAVDLGTAEGRGAALSTKLHCANARDELDCMRSKSIRDVLSAMPNASRTNAGTYDPVVDGHVLTASPIDIMKNGTHNHVPIIQGNDAEEESVLDDDVSKGIKTEGDFYKAVWEAVQRIPGAKYSELVRLYPVDKYPSPRQAYNAIDADRRYICTSRTVLRALSASQPEYFVGRFLYTHTYSDGPFAYYGASHGYELLFIFDRLRAMEFLPTRDEVHLVKTFQDTWGEFAKAGVPPKSLSWKKYNSNEDNYIKFDTVMSADDHLSADQCDYWDGLAKGPGTPHEATSFISR